MAGLIHGPTATGKATSALAAWRRVHISSGLLDYAGASDTDAVGVLERAAFAAGDYVEYRMITAEGTCQVMASDAITAGASCYAAASGKVAPSGSVLVGIAMEASSADGDIIQVMLNRTAITGTVGRSSITADTETMTLPLNRVGVTGTLAALGASAGTPAGAFGITPGTFGSATPILIGEAASGNSKTDYGRFLFALPVQYVAAGNVTLRIYAKISGNVNTAQTVGAAAYKSDKAGGVGASLIATAAQTVTTAYVAYDFVITGTTLASGDLLDIQLTTIADDTGGTANKLISIASIQLLMTVKG